jgi:ADP-ribose pyrophosphatase YjhB (NUDIX family)
MSIAIAARIETAGAHAVEFAQACYTSEMNFCSNCGHSLSVRVPEGDTRPRYCCDRCGAIHYQNPKLVVGTVPIWDTGVLLCRRAIEPRRGFWTLPAGFLENGETAQDGAIRETAEEAGARIELGPLFTMLDVLQVHQVHVFYRARLLDSHFEAGIESLEVKLFDETEIPWSEIAFLTVSTTLEHFFTDRAQGRFETHLGAISWTPRRIHRPDALAADPPSP